MERSAGVSVRPPTRWRTRCAQQQDDPFFALMLACRQESPLPKSMILAAGWHFPAGMHLFLFLTISTHVYTHLDFKPALVKLERSRAR